MFIAFVLILLFILLWVLVGIYSIFAPFTQNIGDVIDFNSAYYWALAGIERWELVLKYRSPGFQWSGGFFWTTPYWPMSDYLAPGSFGNLTSSTNGFIWNISSRTTSIPASGDGNVDYLLSSSDSSNFNQLPYFTSEKINLSLDTTNSLNKDAYDTTSTFSYFHDTSFSGQFRLPAKVVNLFSGYLLCSDPNNPACDSDWDAVNDEVAVTRGLKWFYQGTPFSILPNEEIFYSVSPHQIDYNRDTMLRESLVNTTSGAIWFGKTPNGNWYYSFNPIPSYNNVLTGHNVISTNPGLVRLIPYYSVGNSLLQDTNTTGLQFSFGLVDLLRSTNGNIYPFLEYQLNFPSAVANRFYTVQGNAVVGNYNVKIIMKKSTNSDAQIWDFTIVF